MMSRKVVLPAILAIVLCAALSGSARADPIKLGEVWTTDTSDNPEDTFLIGETVRIHWKDFDSDVVLVILFDRRIAAVKFGVSGTGYKDYLPDEGVGKYWILVADKVLTTFGVDSFFVIPESPLGSIAILAASFAALLPWLLKLSSPAIWRRLSVHKPRM